MKFFTKEELKIVGLIFLFLVLISTPNFIISLRRARDVQRKADVGSIQDALFKYQADFGTFPLAIDGKIAACEPVSYKEINGIKTPIFSPCQWGKSSLADLSDSSYPPYLKVIPEGTYFYFSNGSRFQIYGSLEGKGEDEYDGSIVKRGISCGKTVCNFGKSSGKTPLNMSIEDYESTTKN